MSKNKSISAVKKIVDKLSTYRYHTIHKNIVNNVLKSIEKERGVLDKNLIKLSDEYAKDVLGWIGYAPWLYVYSAISDSFKEGWIPDNYYGKIVVPKMKGEYGKVSDLKPLSKMIFKDDILPDIAYYVNGLFFSSDYKVVKPDQLLNLLFEKNEVVVFKIDNSLQGKGVYLFNKANFDINKIKLLGNGVFQNFIHQHSFFDNYTPNSVATIRITTVINNEGKISERASYLRLGRVSESHVQSGSHIRIPIDLKKGGLDKYGYLPNWCRIESHPDTKVLFMGHTLPYFDKCLETAITLHKFMPYCRSIGWDMIVDKDNNVKLMEWNGFHNDIKFSEATQGPCFVGLDWEKLKL